MIAWAEIQHYCDAIAREFKPRRIVVFGSYAYGQPDEDSDVDVMVVMPYSKARQTRPSLAIRQRIAAGFPVDILVREPDEITRRLRAGDTFITEVIKRGRVMFRYPGHSANKNHARRALADCKVVRREARISLGLPL